MYYSVLARKIHSWVIRDLHRFLFLVTKFIFELKGILHVFLKQSLKRCSDTVTDTLIILPRCPTAVIKGKPNII